MAKKQALARVKDRVPVNRIQGKLLDARRDRLDLRDRPYQPPLSTLRGQFPTDEHLKKYLAGYIKAGLILDQGQEGACTGFGLSCVINYLLFVNGRLSKKDERVSPRMIYHLARLYDEWPGEDYDGSSCRGALKGWHKHGVCTEVTWPYADKFIPPKTGYEIEALRTTLGVYYRIDKSSIVDMQAAIQEIGAIYCSADVHDGWMLDETKKTPSFANLPVIKYQPKQKITGGHAFALVGYNELGFVIQNSWGTGWGLSGFAILTYEDWVDNGFDTWACALGVPKPLNVSVQKPRTAFVPSDGQSAQPRRAQVALRMRAVGAGQETRTRLSEDEAYFRTLVLGNDGAVERKIVHHRDVEDTVAKLGNEIPAEWFRKRRGGDGKDRIVIYAHGGLNDENASLRRIRALGHVFQENGIYPLFLTWKTGFRDSLMGILDDKLAEIAGPAGGPREFLESLRDAASEAKDRALEVASRRLLVRALWEQMKQNAEAAVLSGSRAVIDKPGAVLLCKALGELAEARKGKLEIHLVGHSAGSILLGHMLDLLPGKIASCALYAPACTVEFANATYAAAVRGGKLDGRRLRVHVLTDELERADAVGPYGKSLLYLVSRALEPVHKTPILGLERAFEKEWNSSGQWNEEPALRARFVEALEQWQRFWRELPGGGEAQLVRERSPSVPMGTLANAPTCPAVHGCFDNHALAVTDTIAMINGRKDVQPIVDLDY